MKLPRRNFLHLVAGGVALPAVSRVAWAQAYPSRPVRMIVGFPAGLGPDITARLIAQLLSERFGRWECRRCSLSHGGLCQGTSCQDQHGLGRLRQRPTRVRRAVQDDGRGQHGSCAHGWMPTHQRRAGRGISKAGGARGVDHG
jgi:hypothetical protein